jgi:hypothetical protein
MSQKTTGLASSWFIDEPNDPPRTSAGSSCTALIALRAKNRMGEGNAEAGSSRAWSLGIARRGRGVLKGNKPQERRPMARIALHRAGRASLPVVPGSADCFGAAGRSRARTLRRIGAIALTPLNDANG